MSNQIRNRRKQEEGWVVSDKMDKTRVVEIRWAKPDRQYGKIRPQTTTLKAHDAKNETKIGDRVLVMSTRQLSKTKTWRIAKVLQKR